ncbi:hypothetical protein [Actinokineospora sp. PR83]|nr:hypothetical protein [Actinokineospora sp. PR83]
MPPERPLRFPAPHLDEYRLDHARERRAAAGRLTAASRPGT